MSYYRKPYSRRRFNNQKSRYNQRDTYHKNTYNRSRSRSRSSERRRRPYSKKVKKMFNMYSKYEHLSSSSSSFSENDNEFFVDREKTCPFLLRVFYKINDFNSISDFIGDKFPSELNIYTWEDANLKELAKFINDALKDTVLGMYNLYRFARIYYDSQNTLLRDEIGDVVINDKKSKLNFNVKKTLKEFGFQIGDYLDINITSTKGKNI